MKKKFGFLLCILLIFVCTAALADVAIDAGNFPDEHFRECVMQFDTDNDGKLSEAELENVIRIDADSLEISDLTGIEHFTSLWSLRVSYNNLTRLDLSKNTVLKSLSCDHNQLEELNIGEDTRLELVNIFRNNLVSIDLPSGITSLDCRWNPIEFLDLSQCPELKDLRCDDCSISELDVSACLNLFHLSCPNNKLTVVTLGLHPDLEEVWLSNNPLTELNVSKCPRIKSLVKRTQYEEDTVFGYGFGWFSIELFENGGSLLHEHLFIDSDVKIITDNVSPEQTEEPG